MKPLFLATINDSQFQQFPIPFMLAIREDLLQSCQEKFHSSYNLGNANQRSCSQVAPIMCFLYCSL